MLAFTGCISKSKSQARVFEAYTAGQREGAQQQRTVTVLGDVKNHSIPWSQELTLAKALLAADYTGLRDPKQISITRNGEPHTVNVKNFLAGADDPLLDPGDTIEVRR